MTATTATENDLTTWPGWLRELRARYGKFRRDGRGWTQQELATKLGVARSTVARWETGFAAPLPAFRTTLRMLGRDVGITTLPDGQS